jgi:hypothetical protein
MGYLLVLIILNTGGGAILNEPVRVGHFHSVENCLSAATEAKSFGIDHSAFAFICVRENDLPVVRTR